MKSDESKQHTPGPWHVVAGNNAIWTSVTDDREIAICDLLDSGDKEKDLANACLIAAAPDLLAVCELARELTAPWYAATGEAWAEREKKAASFATQLLAAVAKARGELKEVNHA